jgi:prepilin-type N-terminal cleavage/methylation domain-containing protein
MSSPSRTSNGALRRGESAFTLVELLAVMAVLAILAAATLPVVTSMSRSSSKRAAVNLVQSALDQARAFALSKSANYYVVFADSDEALPQNCWYRSFAVFREEFNPETNRYDRFPTGPWTVLPEGISFKPDADEVSADAEKSVFSAPKEEFYCQPAAKELEAVYFKFSPIGAVDEPRDARFLHIRLFEGFVNADGKAFPTNKVGAPREEVITLSSSTGRAKREEPKITDDGRG